jgi:hypothetical protein
MYIFFLYVYIYIYVYIYTVDGERGVFEGVDQHTGNERGV